jgi:hypothetical protein
MASTTNNNHNINPRPCVYGCGIQIYWNNSVNEYWEVFTKKKHLCPNRSPNNNKTSITPPSNAPKPYYYNNTTRKASFAAANKPKMDNSLMLLLGSIENIQKQYEFLSDLIRDHNGKVHGSQRDKDIDVFCILRVKFHSSSPSFLLLFSCCLSNDKYLVSNLITFLEEPPR